MDFVLRDFAYLGYLDMPKPFHHIKDKFMNFSCEKCNRVIDSHQVKEDNNQLVKELQDADRSDPQALDAFLRKYATTLPETHQLSREIQYRQVLLFKAVDPKDADTNMLLRKSYICK